MVDTSRPVSAFSIANVLLRHRRVMVAGPLLAVAAVLLFIVLRAPEFLAEAAFMPQGSSASGSRLSTLAEQLGVSVATGTQAGDDPAFYVDLIKSREILSAVAASTYDFEP